MKNCLAILSTIIVILTTTVHSYPYHNIFDPINLIGHGFNLLGNFLNKTKNLVNSWDNYGGNTEAVVERTGYRVAEWSKSMNVNPEELGHYVQGDMIIPDKRKNRNGLIAESSRWPGGVIPYVISSSFDEGSKKIIQEAMDDYHKNTCIRFTPYTGKESDYINITSSETGCWSHVGRAGGHQQVNLQIPGCVMKKGTVIHELMHTTGFFHEQSRSDRDDYVDIQWQNIQSGRENNFDKYSPSEIETFGVPYDYDSVMHYSAKAFSRNNLPTIVPRLKDHKNLGQRERFSKNDIQKILKMYDCPVKWLDWMLGWIGI